MKYEISISVINDLEMINSSEYTKLSHRRNLTWDFSLLYVQSNFQFVKFSSGLSTQKKQGKWNEQNLHLLNDVGDGDGDVVIGEGPQQWNETTRPRPGTDSGWVAAH